MIRAATPADAAVLAAIHADCFQGEAAWNAALFARLLSLPGGFGFLHAGGGFLLARGAVDEAEILTLAVLPAARRRGIARALMAGLSPRAARVFLEVSEANQPARAFYAALGFKQVARRRRYYPDGTDALVLRRAQQPGRILLD